VEYAGDPAVVLDRAAVGLEKHPRPDDEDKPARRKSGREEGTGASINAVVMVQYRDDRRVNQP